MAEENENKNKIDDYVLVSVIATGKSSQVWEVMHEQSGHTFAMKMLLPEAMADPAEKSLLKLEAKLLKEFEHPNLIRGHGIVMRKTECYVLLDLFKTPNLGQWIHNDRASVEGLLRKLVEGVCMGLGHMHDKGWIHKDIKPDNILINRSGEVRLIDFSLAVRKATAFSKIMASKKGVIRGTRTYLAPETIRKQPSVPATDLYSFGCVLFECLTGHNVFTGESPQDLLKKHIAAKPTSISIHNSKVSPEMDRLVMKLLAKKPKERFQSCEELLSEFRSCRIFQGEARGEGDPNAEQNSEQAASSAKRAETASDEAAVNADEQRLAELMETKRDSRADDQIRDILARNPAMQETFRRLKREAEERQAKVQKERERRIASLKKSGELGPVDDESVKKVKKKTPQQPAPQQPAPQQPAPQQPAPQQPVMQQPVMQQPVMQPMPPGYGMPGHQMPYGGQQPGMPVAGPPPGYPQQQMPPGGPSPYPPGYGPPGAGTPPGYPPQQMPPGAPSPYPPGYGPPGTAQPPGAPSPYPPGHGPPGALPSQHAPAPPPGYGPPGAAPPPATPAPPPRPATPQQAQQNKQPPAPDQADLPTMTELPDFE